MSTISKETLRESLWNAVIPDAEGKHRHILAIELLDHLRKLALKEDATEDTKLMIANKAFGILSLLSAEIGGWIFDALQHSGWPIPTDQTRDEMIASDDAAVVDDDTGRGGLQSLLTFENLARCPRLHRSSLDPALVLLPLWLLDKMTDDLKALDEGEVRNLFSPKKTGSHGRALLWKQMRHQALHHIEFLVGQGVTKGIARARVAAALQVSVETLRTWEKTERVAIARDLALASRAGNLATVLENDPEFGNIGRDDNLDGYEYEKLLSFRVDPLVDFGRRYAKNFGKRHHSRGGSGDKL